MTTTADAIVIGGGVVGASALFHLQAAGLRRVVLCERRQPGAGASGRSGAFLQLHFCQTAPEAELTIASMPYFERWDELVGAGTCGFAAAGYVRVEPPDREQVLRDRVALLQPLGVQTSILSPADVQQLAPYLRTDDIAIAAYEPGSGYADPEATIAGFLAAACAGGGAVQTDTTVTAIRTAGGAVCGVETTAGPIDAPIVVVAAGAWSVPLLRPLGLELPITGVLTQWMGFALPPGSTSPAVTVGDGVTHSYFRVLRPGSTEILVGLGGLGRRPLGDPEADEAPIPAEAIAIAHERLVGRLPGAAEARSTGGRTGPVTLTPDDLPIIDRHPGLDGLFYFAGDCGSSFKTAPAIGRALAEWATVGQSQIVDISSFGLGRFGGAVN